MRVVLVSLFFALFGSCFLQPIQAQTEKKKALFVIVDGIAADVIEKLKLPNLTAIAQTGGYTRAYVGGKKNTYSQTPTISAVGYNSLLTGTWVNKHNVWDNNIKDPNFIIGRFFGFLKRSILTKKRPFFQLGSIIAQN